MVRVLVAAIAVAANTAEWIMNSLRPVWTSHGHAAVARICDSDEAVVTIAGQRNALAC